MLLSFSANTVDPLILEKTLIGRKGVVDRVEQELLEKILNTQTYQSLLIAPRGSGKTHITKVLHHRLKSNKALEDKILVAYMNEDERGIANFSDFIRHILLSFIKHKEGQYETLNNLIYEVADLPIDKQERAFVQILLQFIDKKGLVVLIENLNVLFDKKTGMGAKGQSKLRSLMHEHNQFSLLATSQNLFYQIQDAGAPFYNFFNIEHLQKLDFPTAFEFIKIQASLTEDEHLKQAMSTPLFKGKVRAIYELTGGNHRLLVMFFNFLKIDLKSDLSKVFVKTMNDLKPYYEQFLNALSPQQQKIVQLLSSKHTPQMGKDIARQCFIAANTLSKQTSELVEKGYLDKSKVGKDTYYELKEPLMRICFEITDNASGAAKLFIDFLSVLYSEEDLQEKYLLFKFRAELDKDKRTIYEEEALLYKRALPNRTLIDLDTIPIPIVKNGSSLEEEISLVLADRMLKAEQMKEAKTIRKSSLLHSFGEELLNRMRLEFKNGRKKLYNDLNFFNNLLEEDDFKENIFIHRHLYDLYTDIKKSKEARKHLNIIIGLPSNNIENLTVIGGAFYKLKEYKKAIECFDKAIKINREDPALYFSKGKTYHKQKKYKKAIEYFDKAIAIDSNNAAVYAKKGKSYRKLKNFEKSIESYKKAISINPEDARYYWKIGKLYDKLKDYYKAIEYYNHSIDINPTDLNKIINYVSLGDAYVDLQDYIKAIESYEKAISINPERRWLYNRIGKAYFRLNKYQSAIEAFKQVILTDRENETANLNLGLLYSIVEQYDLAKEHFTFFIKNNPDSVIGYVFQGLISLALKENTIAKNYFSIAFEKESINVFYLNVLGSNYLYLNEPEKALKILEKGLSFDKKDYGINTSFVQYYLTTNNLEKSKQQFQKVYSLFNKEEHDFIAFLNSKNLQPLLSVTDLPIVKAYLEFLLATLKEKHLLPELWKAFPKAIFILLINIENHSAERLEQLNNYLQETFKAYKEMTIPLLYFDIGIRYLKKGDKRAIYDLSKEERQVFKAFVLDKRAISTE